MSFNFLIDKMASFSYCESWWLSVAMLDEMLLWNEWSSSGYDLRVVYEEWDWASCIRHLLVVEEANRAEDRRNHGVERESDHKTSPTSTLILLKWTPKRLKTNKDKKLRNRLNAWCFKKIFHPIPSYWSSYRKACNWEFDPRHCILLESDQGGEILDIKQLYLMKPFC